jgi:hypothetical protein
MLSYDDPKSIVEESPNNCSMRHPLVCDASTRPTSDRLQPLDESRRLVLIVSGCNVLGAQ